MRTLLWPSLVSRCSRDDGRKLVEILKGKGNKTQTISKKVGHLRAAVNLAIDEGKLQFNPFSKMEPEGNDRLKRLGAAASGYSWFLPRPETPRRLRWLPRGLCTRAVERAVAARVMEFDPRWRHGMCDRAGDKGDQANDIVSIGRHHY